jgi:hypothetical protein
MITLDFVIPGFSKCGTTTLCELLCQHPQVAIPRKEPGYFAQNFGDGPDSYAELFRGVGTGVLRGDASTTYSTEQFGDVASIRLASRFPGLKCIFIARHPMRRLESSFRQMHHIGHLFGVSAERDITATLFKLPNMIADTRYWNILNRYRRFFPDEQIHLVFLEDLARQPEVEVRRCFHFLEIDPNVPLTAVCDANYSPTAAASWFLESAFAKSSHQPGALVGIAETFPSADSLESADDQSSA